MQRTNSTAYFLFLLLALPGSRIGDNGKPPDYSKLVYWAAHPYKQDPSDSIPEPLRATATKDFSVDVFFLYPTTFTSMKDSRWNADIDDSDVNSKTDQSTILFQASAFNEYRVFSPRYRQANLRAYYTQDTAAGREALDLAYEDIKTAFTYYLDHYNNGRPIIIASHSQGSTHAERLLKDFFDNKPLQAKLVAAYVVGMRIPRKEFAALQPCLDSAQTGCFVGWRTFKEGYEPEFVQKENGDSYVTNPLTWTTTDEYASRELNAGAVLTNFNKVTPGVTDAQIHDDILWINRPHFPGSLLIRNPNYHIGDINLFYVNIRNNVRTRAQAYQKQQRHQM
jgi:hypothetical protein